MKNSVCISHQPLETQHKVSVDKPRKVMAIEPKWCLLSGKANSCLPSQRHQSGVQTWELFIPHWSSAEYFSVV